MDRSVFLFIFLYICVSACLGEPGKLVYQCREPLSEFTNGDCAYGGDSRVCYYVDITGFFKSCAVICNGVEVDSRDEGQCRLYKECEGYLNTNCKQGLVTTTTTTTTTVAAPTATETPPLITTTTPATNMPLVIVTTAAPMPPDNPVDIALDGRAVKPDPENMYDKQVPNVDEKKANGSGAGLPGWAIAVIAVVAVVTFGLVVTALAIYKYNQNGPLPHDSERGTEMEVLRVSSPPPSPSNEHVRPPNERVNRSQQPCCDPSNMEQVYLLRGNNENPTPATDTNDGGPGRVLPPEEPQGKPTRRNSN